MAAESIGVHVVIAVGIVKAGVGFFAGSGDASFTVADDGVEVDDAGFGGRGEGENTTNGEATRVANELLIRTKGVQFRKPILGSREQLGGCVVRVFA